MKIQKITEQHRRDFSAVYECEHCGHTETGSGYDDAYFHRTVVPRMECKQCGKTAGNDFRPMGTKYAAHEVV
jgi:primosomal protein N'